MNIEQLNELSKSIHADIVTAGWWDNQPSIITKCVLITTELCEAVEGLRKDINDDHLPHRKMEEVELADALIRTLDVGGRLQLSLVPGDSLYTHWDYNDRESDDFAVLLSLSTSFTSCIVVYEDYKNDAHHSVGTACRNGYARLVGRIIAYAEHRGYDLFGAMEEKCAYNKQRADHKRENRNAAGGKKF